MQRRQIKIGQQTCVQIHIFPHIKMEPSGNQQSRTNSNIQKDDWWNEGRAIHPTQAMGGFGHVPSGTCSTFDRRGSPWCLASHTGNTGGFLEEDLLRCGPSPLEYSPQSHLLGSIVMAFRCLVTMELLRQAAKIRATLSKLCESMLFLIIFLCWE